MKSAAFRITVYRLRDGERAGSTTQGRGGGSDPGRRLIRYQATRLPSQTDIDKVESLRANYKASGTSKKGREGIGDAAAQYAASRMEGQLRATWWETPQSFPLPRAADVLNSSAEWLCDLVKRPVADAASAAGTPGPLVPPGAGITANFVTAPVTALLGDDARVCEIAGMVIGLLPGMHLLLIASAKLFAHDELGDVLAKGFEDVINGDLSIENLGFMAELKRDKEIGLQIGEVGDLTQGQNPNIGRPKPDEGEVPPPSLFP